jgi:hypothetical protein
MAISSPSSTMHWCLLYLIAGKNIPNVGSVYYLHIHVVYNFLFNFSPYLLKLDKNKTFYELITNQG